MGGGITVFLLQGGGSAVKRDRAGSRRNLVSWSSVLFSMRRHLIQIIITQIIFPQRRRNRNLLSIFCFCSERWVCLCDPAPLDLGNQT